MGRAHGVPAGLPCCFFQLLLVGGGDGGLIAVLILLKEAIFVAPVLLIAAWLSWERSLKLSVWMCPCESCVCGP